ncbi:MAG TPA: helix-turn-helix domain-containing protein [Nitrospiraceae bacterium]|jgi:excisionase family DNA binding protein|nr:helix-turn-helix domain-containing protein [Nitrospiraceae bacterium]
MVTEHKNELLTVAETCRYLKVTPRTLYRYIQARQLPGFKLGKEWRFVRSDLERWLRERSRPRDRS